MSGEGGRRWHLGQNDGIRGSRIVLVARKLGKERLIQASSAHKSSEIVGHQNAAAWIEIPLRAAVEAKYRA